ncbi:MAG: DUF47 domain-containing protein [Alphaproteobacteria bacterium]
MENKRFILFKRTRQLEEQITLFLMNILQAGYLVKQGLETYLAKGVDKQFKILQAQVSSLEGENDALRRQMELDLYHHMLLPDMRSDLIDLLEACDKIINKYETDMILWSLEKPDIPKKLHRPLLQMMATSLDCVGAFIGGVKTFFSGANVDDEIQITYALEHQVDMQAIDLKALTFKDKRLNLARQLQLKEFIYSLEKISDMTEDAADKLKVMGTKHTL